MTERLTPFDFAHDAHGHGCFAIDLDGRVHSFVESIRDELIARGVLYQDADTVWRIRWHGFQLQQPRYQSLAVCDFCSARPVTWNIPCERFDLPGVVVGARQGPVCTSIDDWAACDTCGALIEAGQRRQLLARAITAHADHPLMQGGDARLRAISRREQTALHAAFWRRYQGGATRIPSHPFGH